jgi:hypothetical protein
MRCDMSVAHYVLAVYFEQPHGDGGLKYVACERRQELRDLGRDEPDDAGRHAATDQVCHSHAKEIHQARQQAGFGPASEVGPADRALPGANGDVGLLSQDAS